MAFSLPRHPLHYFQMDSETVVCCAEHSLLPRWEHQCSTVPSEVGSLFSLKPTSLNAKGKVSKKENPGNRSCCAWAVPPALTPQVIWAQRRLAEEASQSTNPHFSYMKQGTLNACIAAGGGGQGLCPVTPAGTDWYLPIHQDILL